MREFEYFLFENFDAEEEASNPNNPRNFLGKETDPILSRIAQEKICYQKACDEFGREPLQKLMDGGVVRQENERLVFDCPIFLGEDAEALYQAVGEKATALVDALEKDLPLIQGHCRQIDNGFSVEVNLYHILCGMVFDGSFFDHLSEKGVVATERLHPSGLDYLSVIYEKCDELRSLSEGLLCSYNRLSNDVCALSSFGDAQGSRLDFYRLFRCVEQGNIPSGFEAAATLLTQSAMGKDVILSEVTGLIQSGHCRADVAQLLELLGYARNGELCVPVFLPKHRQSIAAIQRTVEACLGDALSRELLELSETTKITAVRHGVNKLEIANELYHIVFGHINEELVSRGIVAAPRCSPGEGRYLQCIELTDYPPEMVSRE